MRILIAAVCAALAMPAAAQVTAQDVHRAERMAMGLPELRPGADGNNPDAPNAANTEEMLVGDYEVPPLFTSEGDRSPAGWAARREEIARLVEDNWVGRIPETVEQFRVVWTKTPAETSADAEAEQWVGQVIAPDGRTGPTIDATVTFPRGASEVPALIDYTYVWPPGFDVSALAGDGPSPPDGVAMALENGWAHVAYRPQMLQADTAATMQEGVIGLARWPRERTDWGALRAWGWGASKLREELGRDPRIAADRISLTGHSRFGKGVLVAAAFDHAFHDAQVSSSGAGGAKLMRRDFGERWENMASSGAFHWFTPNIMTYAAGDTNVHDLPVDAHMLIALRAPEPLFITSGLAEKGDSWVDPAGMWTAFSLAQPAWELYGASVPRFDMPVARSREQMAFPLGWYQHGEGHVPWPAYDEFYEHAERFADE